MKLKCLLFAALAVASMSALAGTNQLFVNDFEMKPGETKTVEVLLKNADQFSALQADFHYATGLSAGLKADGKPFITVMGRSQGYDCFASVPGNASMRIVDVQMQNNAESMTVTDKGEAILQIQIVAEQGMENGTYTCSIDKQRFSTGKANGEGDVDGESSTFNVKVTSTGVNDVTVAKEVSSVKYVNIAGMESAEPFDGVNVVITTYTDGSKATTKMVK